MANHHPTPELLTAFSAGSLPLSHALCVSTHVESCGECRTHLQRLDCIGAELMENLAPIPTTPESLKSAVLARLDQQPVAPEATDATTEIKKSAFDSAIPKALRQFAPKGFDALNWHHLSPAIEAVKLCTDSDGAKVEILRIKPGAAVPTHTHTGDEYTLLLAGSFSDDTGLYKKNDFIVRDGRHNHRPVATKDQVCLCLTVTEAPIQFTGFFSRWLNPFLRRAHYSA